MNRTTAAILLLVVITSVMQAKDEDVLRPKGRADGGGSSSSSRRSVAPMSIMLGAEIGLNYNMFSQDASSVPASDMSFYKSFSGIAPYISIFGDLAITNNLGVQLRLSYDCKDISNTGSFNILADVYDQNNNIIGDTMATVSTTVKNELRYYALALLLRWNPTPNLVVMVGPTYQELSSSTQIEDDEILSPDGVFYNYLTNPSKKQHTETDVSSITNTARLGLDLSVGYMFPINRTTWLVPRLGFQYFLTQPFPDRRFDSFSSSLSLTNAQLHSLQLGVGVWFTLQQ